MPGRRAAVPGADDPPARGAGADQRPAEPVAAVPQGRPPRASRRPRSWREATRSAAPTSCRCAAGTRSRCSTSRSARAAQLDRKGALWGSAVEKFYASEEVVAGPGAAYHALAYRDAESGRQQRRVRRARRAATYDRAAALAAGALAEDTRVRDALRRLAAEAGRSRSPRPTAAEDAAFAVDAAVLGEGDLIRVRRRLDELAQRVARSRPSVGARLERRVRSLARRGPARAPDADRDDAPRPRRGGHRRARGSATTSPAASTSCIATDHRSVDGTSDDPRRVRARRPGRRPPRGR